MPHLCRNPFPYLIKPSRKFVTESRALVPRNLRGWQRESRGHLLGLGPEVISKAAAEVVECPGLAAEGGCRPAGLAVCWRPSATH